jgi:hypothetical protein
MSEILPLINGVRHSWAEIRVNLFGRPVLGITEVKYSIEQEKEDFYGAGNQPVHRGRGNKKATASLKLKAYELDAIQKNLPVGFTLLDVPAFDISIVYLPTGSDLVKEVVIHNCEFTKEEYAIKQGDKDIESDVPLITSHITKK